jgi:hypothetical protein
MCRETPTCLKPEELKDKPENCSFEQIRKCHGEAKEHPCLSLAGKSDRSKA